MAQLAAFVKLWFTARIFGVGPELDGYNLATVLPSLLAGVMGGLLQTGFFPVRATFNAAHDAPQVMALERTVLMFVGLAGLFVTLLMMLGFPSLVDVLGASSPQSVRNALSFSFPFLVFLVALNFIGDCTGYVLAMRGRFVYAAAAPVFNAIVGALMLYLWPEGGLLSLILSTLIGVVVQVGICLYGLKSTGFELAGKIMAWSQFSQYCRKMLVLGGWTLPGIVFSNMLLALPPIWVARFGEGAVSAFGYAFRLHLSALQLLIVASSIVILAHFSDLVAKNDLVAIKRILLKAAVAATVLGLFTFAAVYVLGEPLLLFVFGGKFNAEAAMRVTAHWELLTIGLPFAIMGSVFTKLWQAQQRPILISVSAGVGLLALGLAYIFLGNVLKEFSLPLAMSISTVFVMSFCIYSFKKVKKN